MNGVIELTHIRTVCIECGFSKEWQRGYPKSLWEEIDKLGKLPPTWIMPCNNCDENADIPTLASLRSHFVDYPCETPST